jgi:hypothetical protein
MLQWLPPEYEREIVYNDLRDGSFVSVVTNVNTGEERVLSRPVYAVHPSGEFALAANFERFYYCRPGYNYKGVRNPKWDQPMHEDDGIFRVDLRTGESEPILNTPEVCAIDPKPVFERRDNWLEHMQWNPSGTRFAFFHRWDIEDGAHETRLYTAAPDGSDLHSFPDTGFYSHMDWRNDDWFTIWTKRPSLSQQAVDTVRQYPFLKRVLKPPYRFMRNLRSGSSSTAARPHQMFVEFNDRTERHRPLAASVITENGHNNWTVDERWMLTDTYANDETRYLRIWDDERETFHEFGTFDAPYGSTEYRCDLHPRWNHSEDQVIVDTAHERKRQIIVLEPDFDWLEESDG